MLQSLFDWAAREFALNKRKGGKTVKEILEHVEKATKKKPPKLAEHTPLDESLVYLWGMFLEINQGEPLTFSEVKAWSELTACNIEAWEVKALMRLDSIKQSTLNKKDD